MYNNVVCETVTVIFLNEGLLMPPLENTKDTKRKVLPMPTIDSKKTKLGAAPIVLGSRYEEGTLSFVVVDWRRRLRTWLSEVRGAQQLACIFLPLQPAVKPANERGQR